jgi:nucleoside-diphosphate-sugar epimerase
LRILFAGATGVLGRAALPHLRRFQVTGLTRSPDRVDLLRQLGVEPAVCDIYDSEALLTLAQEVRPQVVVNFVTDLAAGSSEANNRVRQEGGENVLNAAKATCASRLVVESVAFEVGAEAARALEQLEHGARSFPADHLILRFGRLWGPNTFYETPPKSPTIHIEEAGAVAAQLLIDAPPGTYEITHASSSSQER